MDTSSVGMYVCREEGVIAEGLQVGGAYAAVTAGFAEVAT